MTRVVKGGAGEGGTALHPPEITPMLVVIHVHIITMCVHNILHTRLVILQSIDMPVEEAYPHLMYVKHAQGGATCIHASFEALL